MQKKTKAQKKISVDKQPEIAYKNLMIAVSKIETTSVNKHEQGRTISVIDLPDCQHKSDLLKMVSNPKSSKIVVVALLDYHEKKWRAWAGYPDVRDLKPIVQDFSYDVIWFCENIRDRSEVLMMGAKLPREVLPLIFTDMLLEECK